MFYDIPQGDLDHDALQGVLPKVGVVPFRPLGQSHFVPAPGSNVADQQTYLPAIMSESALRKGLVKSIEPLPGDLDPARAAKLFAYMRMHLSKIWGGDNTLSYPEAVSRLNWGKSAGYPYYYTCEDKACAVTCMGADIQSDVLAVVAGEDMWLPFTLTLKDELRTADRVKDEKTRVFSASNIVHLLASKMLFDRQNDKLRETLGTHPLTIGIGVPGPQFVAAVKNVSKFGKCFDADASGCDQRFFLPVAKLIRELRASFLPPQYRAAVLKLYNDVYCGYVVCLGGVYVMYHNKSGWNNTGDDNGLLLWMSAANYVLDATLEALGKECEISEIDDYWEGLFNGDDSLTDWDDPCSGVGWVRSASKWNLQLELGSQVPRASVDCTFLSHSLKERFVVGLGDVIVAAGNLSKLKSSLEWIRLNSDFSVDECFLMHLLGIRICLWPWKHEFDLVEERIDAFLGSIEPSPIIRNILKARISEHSILDLHFRLEGRVSFFQTLTNCGVPDSIISAIFDIVGGEMPKINAQEVARRAAQSAKDKRQAKGQAKVVSQPVKPMHVKSGTPGGKTSGKVDRVEVVPRNFGTRTTSNFSVRSSTRYKDGIEVEGEDHIDFIVSGSPTAVSGQCLCNFYLSPSEMGGSRLEKYGELYEKFLFDQVEFLFISATATVVRGTVGLAYDPDIMDETPPPDIDGIREYSSYQFNCDAQVWMNQSLRIRPTMPETGYFTNPVTATTSDDRLSYQGQLYVYCVAPFGDPGVTLGRLRMRYRCHFFTPQLQNAVTGAEMMAMPLPSISAGTYDSLSSLGGVAATGNQSFKPKVDSSGVAYIDLAQGVYKMTRALSALSNDAVSTGAGTVSFEAPKLVLNEAPPSSAAPQPWVQLTNAQPGYQANGDVWSSAGADYVVGVPRGGAKLYQNYDFGAGLTAGTGGFSSALDIERLSNYVTSYSGLFLARWQGAQECSSPLLYNKQAYARGNRRVDMVGCGTTGLSMIPSPCIPSRVENPVKEKKEQGGSDDKLRNALKAVCKDCNVDIEDLNKILKSP